VSRLFGLVGLVGLVGGMCVVALAASGCAMVKTKAINSLGDTLSQGTSTFATDEDPELVRDATPFALKTIEILIDQSPKHRGLLLAACSGFTQYSYAFVQQEADYTEAQNLERATAMRERARKLYLRGLGYGLRAFEAEFPGFRDRLRQDPDRALARLQKKHVPLLYWTAASWAAAFSINKADSELSADQGLIEKLMRRALALDEAWARGAIHDFFITWEGGRSSVGGSLDKAREHFERAKQLAAGRRASPFVTYAEVVSVGTQNRKEFVQMLNEALQVDVNKTPEERLANIIAERRARWLLGRADELFVDPLARAAGDGRSALGAGQRR
jgi:predicted anti-sigma-YlaC factor YlaD